MPMRSLAVAETTKLCGKDDIKAASSDVALMYRRQNGQTKISYLYLSKNTLYALVIIVNAFLIFLR